MEHQGALDDLEAGGGIEVPLVAGGEVVERKIAEMMAVRGIGEGVGAGEVGAGDLQRAAGRQ